MDTSTGLYFYEARYHEATLGRFISADTIVPNPGNPQDFNRYTYGNNNLKSGSWNVYEVNNTLCGGGMKTSHAAKGVHHPGECMGQGRVSVASPDPVSDASCLRGHSRHVSSGIHLGLVSDGYPLTPCGYDGWGHAVHPLTPHACCPPTPVG